MALPHLTTGQKIQALVAGFGVILLIIVGFILVPTIRAIYEADKETYNLRFYLEQRYARSANAKVSVKKIAEIKDQLETFDDHLYSLGNELALITLLEETASKNKLGYKVLSSNLDAITDKKITFSISVSGSYTNVLRYITALEGVPYFISINRLTMSSASDRNRPTEQLINATIEMSLYAVN